MRPLGSLTVLTGKRSDVPYNRPSYSVQAHRSFNKFEIGPERMDPDRINCRELSSEPSKVSEMGRPDILPESNFARGRASSGNGPTHAPSIELEHPSEMAGSSRLAGTVPPLLTSPPGNFIRHPNDSLRSAYSTRETIRYNHRAPLPREHHGGNPAGLPVAQPPSRHSQSGRRISSDSGGKLHPTSYSPPYSIKIDRRYGFKPPSDRHSAQHRARTSSGHHGDEYRDANQHDQLHGSGDESGNMGFSPSKHRKRSRAPTPGNCVCCGVRDKPEWRRGPSGARTLCNACGLHFSKLLRRKILEEGNESATVTVDELRLNLRPPDNGSVDHLRSKNRKL